MCPWITPLPPAASPASSPSWRWPRSTVAQLWTVTAAVARRAPDAPADQFSAARAFAHVERIGAAGARGRQRRPRPTCATTSSTTLPGSGCSRRSRTRSAPTTRSGRLRDGPRAQRGRACCPAPRPTGRLFLIAHYDSVQVSYGANDDGAGVATLLETARALTPGPRPRNDVVFVFTDAEEACLCGAEAFVSQDPLAADGGVVLNFESRGSSGPAIMFETVARQRRRGRRVRRRGARTRWRPASRSRSTGSCPTTPTSPRSATSGRFTGLNTRLHRRLRGLPLARGPPSYMDQGSLQQHGRQRAGAGPGVRRRRPGHAGQAVRPATPPTSRCSACWCATRAGWSGRSPALALLAVGGAGRGGPAPRRAITSAAVAAGFGLALIPLLLAPVLAQLFWAAAGGDPARLREHDRPVAAGLVPGRRWSRWSRRSCWPGTALLRRRFGAWPLAIGALGWLAVLGWCWPRPTPGRVVPGRAAGPGRRARRRIGRADRRPAALGRGRWRWRSAARWRWSSSPRPCCCSSRRSAWPPVPPRRCSPRMLGLALLPVLESLYPAGSSDCATAEPAARRPRSPARCPGSSPACWRSAFTGTGLRGGPVRRRPPGAGPAHVRAGHRHRPGAAGSARTPSPGAWTSQYVRGRDRPVRRRSRSLATASCHRARRPRPTCPRRR